MPDLESIIPIVKGTNFASRPIGIVKFEDGVVKFKLREEIGIKAEDLQTQKQAFAANYIVTKEKDGIALEAELIAVSLIDNNP